MKGGKGGVILTPTPEKTILKKPSFIRVKNTFEIVIWTVNTDGLVLSTAAAERCDNKHLWVSFGAEDSVKVL